MTPQEALSMFIEADLSKKQYEVKKFQKVIRSLSPSVYPCYTKLQEAKKDCYPDKESFHVTETVAEIKLQKLMDHTVSRLFVDLTEILDSLQEEEERKQLVLLCKWGCDGAQQMEYKQKFHCNTDSDANLFEICASSPHLLYNQWQ